MNKQDKPWLEFQTDSNHMAKTPKKLKSMLTDPPHIHNSRTLDRISGSMLGLALGDCLGASFEFKPRSMLVNNPVKDLHGGGTWGLKRGQFTDDTSMALCLANSLIEYKDFFAYNQLVRYKWWYQHGYMSSTGVCFDIGNGTKKALKRFQRRQIEYAKRNNIDLQSMDFFQPNDFLDQFDTNCGKSGFAGNGALMRLAPVPLFFRYDPKEAVKYSGLSARTTHGHPYVYDACRYYGALIAAIFADETKNDLLDENFYENHAEWFNDEPLHKDIMKIVKGSFKRKKGYSDGIRGTGYILNSLEAALWAFWSDENSFKKGALAAVNLGDDTDTTAAIYGQLAGAYYGHERLPKKWLKHLKGKEFIHCVSKWITYEGKKWYRSRRRKISKKSPSLETSSPASNLTTEPKGTWGPPVQNYIEPTGMEGCESNHQPISSEDSNATEETPASENIQSSPLSPQSTSNASTPTPEIDSNVNPDDVEVFRQNRGAYDPRKFRPLRAAESVLESHDDSSDSEMIQELTQKPPLELDEPHQSDGGLLNEKEPTERELVSSNEAPLQQCQAEDD